MATVRLPIWGAHGFMYKKHDASVLQYGMVATRALFVTNGLLSLRCVCHVLQGSGLAALVLVVPDTCFRIDPSDHC